MRLSTVSVVFAILAIPAIVSAHGGNNDPNMVHACLGNVSKVARIVGVNGACIPAPPLLAETAAHWAIRRSAGHARDQGRQRRHGRPRGTG